MLWREVAIDPFREITWACARFARSPNWSVAAFWIDATVVSWPLLKPIRVLSALNRNEYIFRVSVVFNNSETARLLYHRL